LDGSRERIEETFSILNDLVGKKCFENGMIFLHKPDMYILRGRI